MGRGSSPSASRVGDLSKSSELDRDFPTPLAFGKATLPMKGREKITEAFIYFGFFTPSAWSVCA